MIKSIYIQNAMETEMKIVVFWMCCCCWTFYIWRNSISFILNYMHRFFSSSYYLSTLNIFTLTLISICLIFVCNNLIRIEKKIKFIYLYALYVNLIRYCVDMLAIGYVFVVFILWLTKSKLALWFWY